MRLSVLTVLAFVTLHVQAQEPPPVPCGGAIILPSEVAFTFHGLGSGCTEQGGTCIVGETIAFTAATTNACIITDFWQFPGDPIIAGTTVNHAFGTPGSFTVTMTAAGPNNSVQVTKTVSVAPASSVPTLGTVGIIALLLSLAIVAVHRLS
jgi:hypothetical protein